MVSIAGYHILEELYNGSRTLVYRAIRDDEKPVVIKLLKNPYPNFNELVQFRNQYTIAKNLNSPGIIQTYSLENYQNSYALVMEDIGGISLKEYFSNNVEALCIESFLQIAISLCDTLDILYRHRIIHKDIKPANILINQNTKQVKIIDFSIASLLPKETQTLINPNVLEGTLGYISPEQSGRMNRGIDYRTDLYSLGVTFYELLTGELPFKSDDAMELVHCHIAKMPTALGNREWGIGNREWGIGNSEKIPQVLSDIVMKLMAKNAEDRYQSALGLKHDLEICLKQFQETGDIKHFQIAQKDICDRFLIPEKLYGRENVIEELLATFERVAGVSAEALPGKAYPEAMPLSEEAEPPKTRYKAEPCNEGSEERERKAELILVAGFSGIGKTAIVNEVHKPIVKRRGYFIKGKFDQFNRNIPFSAFVQGFQDLIGQLLSETDAQLLSWKDQILQALGVQAQVIIDVIPELEQIIGKQPPAPELLGTAAQNRFNFLWQKFIQVFTRKEHPLVIFLDDLQWADSASLKLMQLLMSDENKYLLLIGAYRDNEVFAAHPLILTLEEVSKNAIINTINLAPLSEESLNQLVADTLNCLPERALSLTQLIYQKTQGNPFFSTQFLKSLHEDGFIKFNSLHSPFGKGGSQGGWICDITKVKAFTLTDDVVEFMGLQLQKLPQATQNVLKLAACIGNQFDLATLAIVCDRSVAETAANLWKALQLGLILPQSEVYKFYLENTQDKAVSQVINYKFLHDRVQQAAYSLIPETQKQTTHYHIGKLLLKQIPPESQESRIFELVNQLNYGADLITEQFKRDELAQLNLIACRKARSATAYKSGSEYVRIGLFLLGENAWQRQYEMTLAFHDFGAEFACLCSDFDTMDYFVETVIAKANTLLEKVNVYRSRIQVNTAGAKFIEAIAIAQQLLQQFGVTFPETPTPLDIQNSIAEISQLIANREIGELVNLPQMTDREKIAIIQIANSIIPAAKNSKSPLFPFLIILPVKLSIEYGNIPDSAFAYACYGILACHMLQDVEMAIKFAELAIALVDKLDAKAVKPKVFDAAWLFILHRKTHFKEILPFIQEGYVTALEVGDFEFAGIAQQFCLYSFWCGKPLSTLEQETRVYYNSLAQLNQLTTANLCQIYWQSILNLLGEAEHPTILSGEALQEAEFLPLLLEARDFFGLCFFYLYKQMLCYLEGEIESAKSHSIQLRGYLKASGGTIIQPIFYFYDSLITLAALVPSHNTSEELQQVEQNQIQLQQWANYAPMNYQHKYDLIAAEKYRILDDKIKAIEFYDKAIFAAKENGFIQEEALANELLAKFYLDWDKEKVAATYMQEAYYCYAKWGAKSKTDNLEKCYPHLLASILQIQNNSSQINETYIQPINKSFLNQTIQTSRSSSSVSEALDIASILKATQAISSEIKLEELISNLLQILIENSGAEKAALVFHKNDTFSLEAIATKDNGVTLLSIPYETSIDIPSQVINYVKRSLKTVVLDNATTAQDFIRDEYLIEQKPYSLLCTPILDRGKLIGLLYLENKLTIGAFTRQRLEVINLLCTQAAISLENAQLYEQSQSYAQQLELSFQTLQTSQDQLIVHENRMQTQIHSLFELSQSQAISNGDLKTAFLELTEKTAFTLQVERVSIWFFDENRTKVECADLFEKTSHSHSQGFELFLADKPNYFNAICLNPILAVNDAQNDVHTSEFKESYLIPLNILSMLDSSVQIDGEVSGVVCCEEVGSKRLWTKAEQNFVRSVANLTMLAIESNRRHKEAKKLKQVLLELQQAQLQMVQNEKMATLGNLVAGVAHEVNNPIGFLKGSISNAEDYIKDLFSHIECYQENYPTPEEEVIENAEDIDLEFITKDLPKLLDSMKIATNRIKDISTSLRTFSRADTAEKVACNIHEGIDSTILILKYRLKANEKRPGIEIIKEYDDLPPIKCFLGQLNQVFMNIIANAIDALDMTNEGKTFAQIQTNPHKITIHTEVSTENNAVFINIKDNGPGMVESIRERIFDNLFTTKGVGKGTGLGLAIARAIIEEIHDGKISCNSTLGEGTEFLIELPIN